MKKILRSEDRGYFDHGWLKTFHTFSFAGYYNPERIRYKTLRVINEDFVAPGEGFGTHPHDNMEIITYVISGALSHRDSMGNVKTVRAGEVQAMSAGTGVEHSEFNPSDSEPTHLIQIWIFPERKGLSPSYSEWRPSESRPALSLIASPDGRTGSIKINQDASIILGTLKADETAAYELGKERGLWLQLFKGELKAGEDHLRAGDALAIDESGILSLTAGVEAQFLVFDV